MSRIFTWGLPETLRDEISSSADAPALERATSAERLLALVERESGAEEAIAVALGPEADDPIALAQRLRALDSAISISIIATPIELPKLTRALRFSPFVGSQTRCVSAAAGVGLAAVLNDATAETQRRRRHAEVVAASRIQLASTPRPSTRTAQHLDRLLTHAPIGVVVLDSHKLVVSVNPRAMAILDASEREIVGAPFDRFVPEMQLGPLTDPETLLANDERSDPTLVSRRRANGKPQHVQITSCLVPADRDRHSFMLVLEDVSERETSRVALIEAKSAADAANAAKSRFLTFMSHEVRTPIGGILGLIHLLQETPLSDDQDGYLDTIETSARALLDIVNDVLDISKVEAGKLELESMPFEIRCVLDEVVRLLSPNAERSDLVVRAVVDPAVPAWVEGDPARVRQILVNLVGNALKFTHAGGVVMRIRPLGGDPAAGLRFEVVDSGIGMTPEQASRIFESYAQAEANTARKYGGTGLGLAISKQLVEQMGGEIGVSSVPGTGSTFWFRLPLCAAAAPETRAAPDDAPAPEVRPAVAPRVLVAEDNAVNQMIAKAMLERLGAQVDVAADGFEALAYVEESVEESPYDLILMDLEMPGLEGDEAARRIRERGFGEKQLPIVALTANPLSEVRARCLRMGMNDAVNKPLEHEELRRLLADWIRSQAD